MAGILIYSNKTLLALELLTAARLIAENTGLDIKAAAVNDDRQGQELAAAGAETIKINTPELSEADTALMAQTIAQTAAKLDCNLVLLSSNRRGKELAGRLAQIMKAGCLTDVSRLEAKQNRVECQRNALGGATVATQYIEGESQVLAIAPKAFESAPIAASSGKLTDLTVEIGPSKVKLIDIKPKTADSVDISDASVLVAVGQGLNSKEDLPMAEELARLLGGEVACSKPVATDKKWLPEDRVIGLSGKLCKPDLAILLGISGQVQFTVGIREAKVIVAVNSDENASINQFADYILTADLHEAVPTLSQMLK